MLFFVFLIPCVVTLQRLPLKEGSEQSSNMSFWNVVWLVFCILDFVSDIGTAYLLRPTEFCQGDDIIGGWQFRVQAYVVVLTTSILLLFLTYPFLSIYAEDKVHLWPGLFALTLTGAIADFTNTRYSTYIYLVLVYVEESPALVVKCNLLSHDLARDASPQWWVWATLILSSIGVVYRLGTILRRCCGGEGEQTLTRNIHPTPVVMEGVTKGMEKVVVVEKVVDVVEKVVEVVEKVVDVVEKVVEVPA